MSTRATIVALAILAGIAGYIVWPREPAVPEPVVTSFAECAAAGYPVAESYPRQCRAPNGDYFEVVAQVGASYEQALPGDAVIDEPVPGAIVGARFAVAGKARDEWFGSGVIRIEVLAPDGMVLAEGNAHTRADTAAGALVPFRIDLSVSQDYRGPATIVLVQMQGAGRLSVPITIGE